MGNQNSSRMDVFHRRSSDGNTRRRHSIRVRRASEEQPRPMLSEHVASVSQVSLVLRHNGLGPCNLMLGIDFTTANARNGEKTYDGRCLHAIAQESELANPYEEVIETMTQTLRAFEVRDAVPCYGFGDRISGNHSVFTFLEEQDCMLGLPVERIQTRYRGVAQNVVMADSMSLAPIIYQGLASVNETGEFSVLLIIMAFQVERSSDVPQSDFNEAEQKTIDAIILASHFPLSIVVVGVGDGPWLGMKRYQEYIGHQEFDNFHFVEYQVTAARHMSPIKRRAQLALHAFSKLPDQYRAVQNLGYLRFGAFNFNHSIPGVEVHSSPALHQEAPQEEDTNILEFAARDSEILAESYISPQEKISIATDQSASTNPESEAYEHLFSITDAKELSALDSLSLKKELLRLQEEILCCICEERKKSIVFQCGHETCHPCSTSLTECPTCRQHINLRIRRFG